MAIEVERLGSPDRQVDEAVLRVGTAVVEPHDDRASVREVGDAQIARHRQRRVCRRNTIHVIDFAVGGRAAVKIRAVPGGDAFGAVALIFPGIVGTAVELIGLANLVAAAALGDRLALLYHPLAVFRLQRVRSRAGAKRRRGERQHANAQHQSAKSWPPGPPHSPLATPGLSVPAAYRSAITAGMGPPGLGDGDW